MRAHYQPQGALLCLQNPRLVGGQHGGTVGLSLTSRPRKLQFEEWRGLCWREDRVVFAQGGLRRLRSGFGG